VKFRSTVMIAAVLVAMAGQAAERQVKIYVYADTDGFVDEKSESAADLAATFVRADDPKAAKERIVLVDQREQADIVVEIVGRGYVETGTRTRDLFGPSTTRAQHANQLRAKLTVGEYSTDVVGYATEIVKPWRAAASRLHSNIERFVKKNGDQLAR
jgi:ABC-type thiamine transport system substrate-binding protein